MKREKAAALATYLRMIRPEWDSLATIDAIYRLDESDRVIELHALRVANDRQFRTPAALGFVPIHEPTETKAEKPGNKTPCDICGRTEWQCKQAAHNTWIRDHVYTPETYRGTRAVVDADLLATLAPLAPRLISDD